MNPTNSHLELQDYVRVLWRRRWIVVASTFVFGLLAFGLSSLQPKTYAANVKLLIQRPTASTLFDPSIQQRINTDLAAEIEQQFFNSQDVKRLARERLGYSASASASAGGRGSVLTVQAVDRDPARAADIANAFAQAYIDARRDATVRDFAATAGAIQSRLAELDQQIAELDQQIAAAPDGGDNGSASLSTQREALANQKIALEKNLDQVQVGSQLGGTGGPQILQSASTPSSPVSPKPIRNLILGLLVGLLLGIAAAFALEYLDESIKGRADLETATGGAPLLAIVPRLPDWKNTGEARLVSIEAPMSPPAEAYRTLRTSVQFADLKNPIRLLQITSPRAQDGKSTTATNLAVALARSGQRVILIDCDLRRPRAHDFFGLSNKVGFTSVLLGDAALTEAVQSVPGIDRLKILASGPIPPNPSELLGSKRTAELLQALRDACDVVVVDSPPVLPVADSLILSDLADAVILVVAVGSTTKREAHRAYELLTQVEAPVIGTVLNTSGGESGYGYGYGYSYGYSSKTSPEPEPAVGAAQVTTDV